MKYLYKFVGDDTIQETDSDSGIDSGRDIETEAETEAETETQQYSEVDSGAEADSDSDSESHPEQVKKTFVINDIQLLKLERVIENNLYYIFHPSKITYTTRYFDLLISSDITDKEKDLCRSVVNITMNSKWSPYHRNQIPSVIHNIKVNIINDVKRQDYTLLKLLEGVIRDY